MIALVDTNVVSYILVQTPGFADRARRAVVQAHARGGLVVNPIVYAELCGVSPDTALLDKQLRRLLIDRDDLPWEAAPLAAEAFRAYRAQGGPRTSLLPDFYIGAHALARGYSLLSFDERRYRAYFPNLDLIVPA